MGGIARIGPLAAAGRGCYGAGMDVDVDIVTEDARWEALGLESLAVRAVGATLARVGLEGPAEVSLLAAGDARVAALNEAFRGKARPTNVLSWPAEELVPPEMPEPDLPGEPAFLGDIALAWETCAAEAEAAGKPLADHVTHLTVHAVLHLLGYDHETEAEARRMEALEVEILAMLGLPSPY